MKREVNIKVNARHIGQLGRELVTDYVTALTELVKNSYDADSEVVEVKFENILSGDGRIIIADTGSGFTMDDIENKWAVIGTNSKVKKPYSAKFNRRCAGRKGIGRYSVERLAEYCTIYSFTEYEKPIKYFTNWNKYEGLDFNELRQRVEILKNQSDYESAKYLKRAIEYLLLSDKIDDESKAIINTKILLNHNIDFLMFYSKENLKRVEEYLYPICRKYIEIEERVEEIKNVIEELEGDELDYFYQQLKNLYEKKNDGAVDSREMYTGTFLVLDNLRDEWKKEDIEKVTKEFRLLVSPFKEKDNFTVFISAPDFEFYDIKLENNILKQRYAKVEASLKIRENDGSASEAIFSATYEDIKGAIIPFNEISKEYLCGDLEITLYYFLRDKSLKFEGLKAKEAKNVLDAFCGVKIYRDGFRVRPYGEEGNDWLLLDRSKIRDPHSYRVGNNQVIGVVNINSDDNPLLIDATNREAIIENEAFVQLKNYVKKCINIIENHRYKEYLEEKKKSDIEVEEEKRKKEQEKLNKTISQKKEELTVALRQGNVTNAGRVMNEIIETVSSDQKKQKTHYEKAKQEYEKKLKESNDELQLYKNLASIGIIAGSFGHETDDSIARIMLNIMYPKTRLLNAFPNDENIKNSFFDLDNDIHRISCYSDLLIAFLKKKKRSEMQKLSFKNVIEEIVKYYKVLVDEYSIKIDTSDLEKFECEIPMKQIDIESIIVNLLTNSFEALKGMTGSRIIKISTHFDDDYKIVVEDSGLGVPEELREWIFIPLNTTKDDEGVGLGLTIVKDVVDSYSGEIKVDTSDVLGGARFVVKFPIMEV